MIENWEILRKRMIFLPLTRYEFYSELLFIILIKVLIIELQEISQRNVLKKSIKLTDKKASLAVISSFKAYFRLVTTLKMTSEKAVSFFFSPALWSIVFFFLKILGIRSVEKIHHTNFRLNLIVVLPWMNNKHFSC